MKITVSDIGSPELACYASLTDGALRNNSDGGMMIVESPKVIATALDAGMQPMSLLCEEKHIAGDAADIIRRLGDEIPVYTGSRDLLASLTGYKLTRGVLCAMRRPLLPEPEKIIEEAKRICVLYDICDSTNIGAIFRTAAALGFDGVLLSPESCDPFNRRCIRVSMGAVFQIPWSYCADVTEKLHGAGFETAAMALSSESVYLDEFKVEEDGKYAVILGSEGYGLPAGIIERCRKVVKIPMHHGVDSLNVGAAAAITLWHFRKVSPTP